MNSLENQGVSINLVLFKRLGFYQIFDPNNTKYMFNCNIYQLTLILLCTIGQCINIFGLLGFILNMKTIFNYTTVLQIIIDHLQCFLSLIKVTIHIYNADKIWELLDAVRTCFLTSPHCSKHIDILRMHCKKSVKMTNLLFIVFVIITFIWFMLPIFLLMTKSYNTESQRYVNICSMIFPVSIHVYNDYFLIFYAMEVILLINNVYVELLIHVFIISFSYLIIGQYEVILKAFENVGYEQIQEHPDSKYLHIPI